VRFFFPDSQDQIDPFFDFQAEAHGLYRVRQRDDQYAHEALHKSPYDGLLLSKVIVDGPPHGGGGKYTLAQRQRLYRQGARAFFRLERPDGHPLEIMGDCGAFAYAKDSEPPLGVEEVMAFYDGVAVDYGVSVDHIVFGFATDDADLEATTLATYRRRQQITLELAAEFLARHRAEACSWVPVGVAQGWSAESYAQAVSTLQKMGYRMIGLGGLAALKTPEILAALSAAGRVRAPGVGFHLFGVTRTAMADAFSGFGVVSFDSTSPFRQAFKDADDNYYWPEGNLAALRVPQVDENPRLKGRILAGEVDQAEARRREQACLRDLRRYRGGRASLRRALSSLVAYEEIYEPRRSYREDYRRTLEERPWVRCPCAVCKTWGVEVAIFRGAQRNKRRGFHNLAIFADGLRNALAAGAVPAATSGDDRGLVGGARA
jgi:hypothetical protein